MSAERRVKTMATSGGAELLLPPFPLHRSPFFNRDPQPLTQAPMESVRKQAEIPDPPEEMILGLLLQAMSDEQGRSEEFLHQERALTN